MKIKINDKEIELKYSFRSLIIYENIQNKTFAPESTTDVLIFFYSTILGADRDIQLSFDDFLDMIDENPNLVLEFSNWLISEMNKNEVMESKDEVKEEEESKKNLSKVQKK